MNSLEQYLKPPTNNQEDDFYNQEGEEGAEEENDYIQNQENGNDNGDNQDVEEQQDENLKDSKKANKIKNNIKYDDEINDEIIQGINSIYNMDNINIQNKENKFDNEGNNNIENEKKEFEYNTNNNFLNMNENENENTDSNYPDELMNELLYKIRKIKENRAKTTNSENDINKINTINNNIDSLLNMGLDKTRSKKIRNEYLGKLNINNQLIQNNPKMKELANLLKEYNRDKNENDKMQINFYNNNQINIVKPEVFFNNNNNSLKNKNINYYDKNYENKHYISVIDGKAIINGQRINVNNGFFNKDKKENFNEINRKKLFDNEKFLEKRSKLNNMNTKWNSGNNLDFKLNNLNFYKNKDENFKVNENKVNKISKSNFLTKDYYNEELNKINDSLFNIDNIQNKLRK